jgi:hypothetical protein
MVQAANSSEAGYLQQTSSSALQDDALTNFFLEVVVGITNFDPTLIRPRWQPEPANIPAYPTNWCAIGIEYYAGDVYPLHYHVDTGDGHTISQTHENLNLLLSFYGPNATSNASLLRDGFFFDQNRAALFSAGIGLTEISRIAVLPELYNNKWWQRADLSILFKREVRRIYPVLNLLSAKGTLTDDESGFSTNFDTDRES